MPEEVSEVDTSFRLFDFNIFDEKREENNDDIEMDGNDAGDGNDNNDDADTRGEKIQERREIYYNSNVWFE